MRKAYLSFILGLLVFSACQRKSAASLSNKSDAELNLLATELAHRYILTDGHVDLPYRLRVKNFRLSKEYLGIPIKTKEGDFDYERAKQGGLDAPFMSIYIPASYQVDGGAKALADTLTDMVNGITKAHPDKFPIAKSPKEVKAQFKKGLISIY